MTTKIKAHRVRNDLTQSALAESLGISQQFVQRIESGASCPSLTLASRICNALHAAPCAIFPDFALACSGLPVLPVPNHVHSVPLSADWQLNILGANEFGLDYWVAEGEARRIQRSLAQYSSGSSEPGAGFLIFTASSRAVAVNLGVIDRICLEQRSPEDQLRSIRDHHHATEITVFLRDGLHFRTFAVYVNDAERKDFSTNLQNLAQPGHTPFFVVTKGMGSSNLIRADRISLIEMDPTLLNPRGCRCTIESKA